MTDQILEALEIGYGCAFWVQAALRSELSNKNQPTSVDVDIRKIEAAIALWKMKNEEAK